MDVQICSVMTELHVNTHSGKHTDVHVCVCVCVWREKSLMLVKQEEVGAYFSVLSFCPWRGHLNFLFYPSLSVKWGSASHPGNGYSIFYALGWMTVMR